MRWLFVVMLIACGGSELESMPADDVHQRLAAKEYAPPAGMAAHVCPPEAQDVGWTCHWNDCASCHADGTQPWLRCIECQRCKHGKIKSCKPCDSDEECK